MEILTLLALGIVGFWAIVVGVGLLFLYFSVLKEAPIETVLSTAFIWAMLYLNIKGIL